MRNFAALHHAIGKLATLGRQPVTVKVGGHSTPAQAPWHMAKSIDITGAR